MKIGVLGGGQLGRMLALAGYPLGLRFRFFDPAPEAPAGQLAEHIVAQYDDAEALNRFAEGVDLVTYEFENVPIVAVRQLAQRAPVYPPPVALAIAQDRLGEKKFFESLNIPTPPFMAVDSADDLATAINRLGLPAVLKTRRHGYDGKGQFLLRRVDDIETAWATLGGSPLILEKFIPFKYEFSVLAARGQDGVIVIYPIVENRHRDGILRLSLAPAQLLTTLKAQAEDYTARVMKAISYVGVLAIEFFLHDNQFLANEMAPRVHNSGHWTIEGAATSQFENHLRAIVGLPLGSAEPRGHAAMINLIGAAPDTAKVLAIPGANLHLYDKAPRPGRKLGHITLITQNAQALAQELERLQGLI